MHKSEKTKMLAGELYRPGDPELQADMAATKVWLARYNAALALPPQQRADILAERLAFVGRGAVIRPPFHCDYGYNIRLGDNAFLNFGCVILDVASVEIGDGAQIGPAVQIYAADHPRDPAQRLAGVELGRPVRIGRNAWIGGGAIILPGVTVGDDAIVGAGSVVTRNVAAGATVVGNPARVAGGSKSTMKGNERMVTPELLREAEALLAECRRRGITLATAESCTGGLIAAALTAIAGSSDVVDRGFVTYSNAAKTEMLGVPGPVIEAVGAVSEEVARHMAEGAVRHSPADIAVAVTGVAGPGGGSAEKPVGLVWFGLARRGEPTSTEHQVFPGDRTAVRLATVAHALTLLRRSATLPR